MQHIVGIIEPDEGHFGLPTFNAPLENINNPINNKETTTRMWPH